MMGHEHHPPEQIGTCWICNAPNNVAQNAVMHWMNSSTDVRRHIGTEIIEALRAAGYVVTKPARMPDPT